MSRRPRRLVAALTTTTLLLGGLAFAGFASAADVCPTYTDAAGDSAYIQNLGTPDGNALTNPDDDLDLLAVSHSVDEGVFSTTVKVAALGKSGPYFNFSDRFTSGFTVAGKAAQVVVYRDYTQGPDGTDTDTPVITGTLLVDDAVTTAPVTVALNFTANTITSKIPVAEMEKALGGPLAGKPFSAMTSTAEVALAPDTEVPGLGALPTSIIDDDATAPASAAYAFGQSCSGGGTPTPTPTDSPTPSPTPSSGGVAGGKCPTYTDPAGDNAIDAEPSGATKDGDVDVVAVSHSVDSGVFTTSIKLAALNETGPDKAFFDRFGGYFTVAKKAVSVRVDRDFSGSTPVITSGLVAAGVLTSTKVTAVFDYKASTVTLGVTVADLEKALGASLTGEPFSAMSAIGRENFTPAIPLPLTIPVLNSSGVQLNNTDTATAPASASYLFGQSCSGGGTPIPDPTPTDSPTPDPTPTEDPGPPADEVPPVIADAPRAGCFAFTDAAGDAKPGSAPLTSPQNDDDLDLLGVAARSTATELKIFGKVAALGSAPTTPVFTGHVFGASFSVGGKKVTLSAAKAGAATATPATVKATALFDTAKSTVVFTIAKADLVTVAPVADGTPLTDLTMTSAASNPGGTFAADTAAGSTPEQKTYAYGDNGCFFPPAAKLVVADGLGGVFSDASTVTATLTDADDNVLDNTFVHLQIPGMSPMRVVTDGDGVATFTFPVTAPAGLTSASVWYVGDEDNGPVTVAAPFTVTIETSVLKAVAGKGTVTATLTDNDKTALAGQPVLFTVGKKVTTIKTNAKGVAVLSKQLKGTSVKVTFAGVKDKYTAPKAITAKVG